jgi:cellobiose-specific phosphotransferase system component IIB
MKDNTKIKVLMFMDIDGTLMDSPMPDVGKVMWREKTGIDYPHIGWWGRPESLDTKVFDIRPFPALESIINKNINNPEIYVVLLTSRLEKLRTQVQNVLDVNNIHVDKLDMKTNENTKGQKVLNYLNEFPNLEYISVFDDSDSDIQSYKSIDAEIPENIKFNIFLAKDGGITLLENADRKLKRIINEVLVQHVLETENIYYTFKF